MAIACFFLRLPSERDELSGGTRSSLEYLSASPIHQTIAVANDDDALRQELARRGIELHVLAGDFPFGGSRKHRFAKLRSLVSLIQYNARFFAWCVRHRNVAVVQCDDMAALMVLAGAKLAGKRVIVVVRNYKPFLPTVRRLYRVLFALADRLIATSQALRESLVSQCWRHSNATVSCIYNAVDMSHVESRSRHVGREESRRYLEIANDEVAVGVVGFFFPLKRQAEFLEHVVVPLRSGWCEKRIRFYFLGGFKDSVYAERCAAIVRENQLEPCVDFRGYVSDMHPWYMSLDYIVYPGIEGIARSLIEAHAYGLPVIAFRGCNEVVLHGETGRLCADFVEMRAEVLQMSERANWRAAMGERARKHVNTRFNVKVNRRRYEAMYGELARPNSRANIGGSTPTMREDGGESL